MIGQSLMTIRKLAEGTDGPDWIAVCVTHNLPEAHIIAGKLRTYDIPAMIHQEAGASAIGITLGNLGEIKILVSPADYERALELLQPADNDLLEASSDKIRLIWTDDADRGKSDDDE